MDELHKIFNEKIDVKISKDLKTIKYTVFNFETGKSKEVEEPNKWERENIEWSLCPKCHNHLVRLGKYIPAVRRSDDDWVPAQYHSFYGCSNFPNCKYSKSIVRDVEFDCDDPYEPYYPDDLY